MDSRFLHYVYRSVRRTVTYTPFYVFRTSRCKRTFLVLKIQKGVEQLVDGKIKIKKKTRTINGTDSSSSIRGGPRCVHGWITSRFVACNGIL